jgi:hypothetical protein
MNKIKYFNFRSNFGVKIFSNFLYLYKNNPLYIKNFSTSHPDLKYHYIAHTSCDVIEERGLNLRTNLCGEELFVFKICSNLSLFRTYVFSVGATGSEAADTYLGLLYAMEDLDVLVIKCFLLNTFFFFF